MADRRASIVLLLGAIHDHTRWYPRGALRTNPRFAPVLRTPCSDCGGVELRDDLEAHNDRAGSVLKQVAGRGTKTDSFKRVQPCATCGGFRDPDGSVVAGSGWIRVDPMDPLRQPISTKDEATTSRPRMVKCDRCQDITGKPTGVVGNDVCPSCHGDGERPKHLFELRLDTQTVEPGDPIDGWLDKIAESADFDLLIEAEKAHRGIVVHVNKAAPFGVLRGHTARVAHDAIFECYIAKTRQDDTLTPFDAFAVDLGIAYIGARLPEPLEVPRWLVANAKELEKQEAVKGHALNGLSIERRNAQIRKWDRERKPRSWIKQQSGLSDRQLREIINGGTVAAWA